ncbi:MAG: Carbon monoxide dehydrogenase subunit G [Chloroflexi bacterium]|jgi:carbon monoxide dehydrogenase subunit G|nr:MAG: Carbon monoxide dehydrogenase subunit G [Chloroflexota bacterium]
MHVEKKYSIKAPISKVWGLISKPESAIGFLPDIQSFQRVDDSTFTLEAKAPFSFVSGTIRMDLKFITPKPHLIELKIGGKSIGSNFEIAAHIQLIGNQETTLIEWTSEMKSGGLLKAIPDTVLAGAAVQMADRTIENMKDGFNYNRQ